MTTKRELRVSEAAQEVAERLGDYSLLSDYGMILHELGQLGEVFVEATVVGDTSKLYQISKAIDQAVRESRKYEKKLRKKGYDVEKLQRDMGYQRRS